jgi:Asp-tRNA(Asn)/Glu-tRNA(Gln) amidotransferase A subunit family amidase
VLAFVKTSRWSSVDEDAREAFAELAAVLGDRLEDVELATPAEEAAGWHRHVMESEMTLGLAREWTHGREGLSPALRERLESGHQVRARDYLAALARIPELNASFAELFEQRYDAILTPAAFGTAPRGLGSTGDPAFCSLWTLCGMPALSVPLLRGAGGLPLGVQLVGPRHGDGRLLRTARWLVDLVASRSGAAGA